LSDSWLLWGLLFGAFELGFFVYGKKQKAFVPLVCGLVYSRNFDGITIDNSRLVLELRCGVGGRAIEQSTCRLDDAPVWLYTSNDDVYHIHLTTRYQHC
jgi:hypothetical protein